VRHGDPPLADVPASYARLMVESGAWAPASGLVGRARAGSATEESVVRLKRIRAASGTIAAMSDLPDIVLVHGAWADGSSWSAVIEPLQARGYHVTAPQFPETSLADDVARLRHVLSMQSGPTIVAGHSYGGHIITALGTDAPNVAGLVYIAAFGLDEGESLGALLGGGPPTPSLAHLIADSHGFGWLPEDDFVEHFAVGVDPVKARVLCAVQQPISMSAFDDVMGAPAWRSHPSWYLVATDDQAIPPDAERQFAARMGATTVEVDAGHLAMVTHPDEVVKLIEAAAVSTGQLATSRG
jgi:pimeloyl-ACP methyl ester carboxylesterase